MSGTSWTEVLNAKSFFGTSEKVYVRWLNVSPNGNTVYALVSITYYNQGILLKSTDGGNTWSRTNSSMDGKGISLAVNPTNPNKLYLGSGTGVHRSEDGGYTWQSINNGLPSNWESIYSIAVDPTNPQNIYIGTPDTVYQSSNGGNNWQQLGDAITNDGYINGIAITPSNPAKTYVIVGNKGAYTLQSPNTFLLWTR